MQVAGNTVPQLRRTEYLPQTIPVRRIPHRQNQHGNTGIEPTRLPPRRQDSYRHGSSAAPPRTIGKTGLHLESIPPRIKIGIGGLIVRTRIDPVFVKTLEFITIAQAAMFAIIHSDKTKRNHILPILQGEAVLDWPRCRAVEQPYAGDHYGRSVQRTYRLRIEPGNAIQSTKRHSAILQPT